MALDRIALLPNDFGDVLFLENNTRLAGIADGFALCASESVSPLLLCTDAIEPPCTDPYARWGGRSVTQPTGDLLPES